MKASKHGTEKYQSGHTDVCGRKFIVFSTASMVYTHSKPIQVCVDWIGLDCAKQRARNGVWFCVSER